MSELRQRSLPTPSPPTPPSPALRPTISRTNTGTDTPQYSIDQDELFSGLGLLDLLVLVDAHLELWGRGFRKKSAVWREKAALTSSSALQKLPKLPPLPKLPRVKSDVFLPSSPGHRDREKIERAYRDVRTKLEVSMKRVGQKWEEEKTVRMRDKVSFLMGVMNVLVSALLLGFAPEWIPAYYTGQVLVYLPLRVSSYKKRLYHYFLFDLCYAINLLCLVYLWILPGNPFLFEACYGLTLGSLGTAIATWRNSLVFHSLDKVISLAIHIFPPFVFTTIRHFYPNANVRYPALDHLKTLKPWRSIGINMVVYLIWQALYYRYVIVARKEKIKQGRATSFTFLINDKRRLIGKIAAKVPPEWREAAFMLGQAVYTFVTLLIPVFVLYDSRFWSSVYLLVLFAVSAWNGASFYLEVYSRRFEKELIALQKEFKEQQSLLAQLNQSPQMDTGKMVRSESGEGEEEEEEERSSLEDLLEGEMAQPRTEREHEAKEVREEEKGELGEVQPV